MFVTSLMMFREDRKRVRLEMGIMGIGNIWARLVRFWKGLNFKKVILRGPFLGPEASLAASTAKPSSKYTSPPGVSTDPVVDKKEEPDARGEKIRTLLDGMSEYSSSESHHGRGKNTSHSLRTITPMINGVLPGNETGHGALELAGVRYLYDNSIVVGMESGVRPSEFQDFLPEFFGEQITWERSLKPGMLCRATLPVRVTLPELELATASSQSSTPVRPRTPRARLRSPFNPPSQRPDQNNVTRVSVGDILMFVGFVSDSVEAADVEVFSLDGAPLIANPHPHAFLPISMQRWLIDEKMVDFPFTCEEVQVVSQTRITNQKGDI